MRIYFENGKTIVKPDGISDKWMFIDKSVDLSKTYFFTPYNEYPDVPRDRLEKVLPKGAPYGRSNIIQEYVNELGDEKILKYVPKSVLDGIYGLLDEFVKLVRDNADDYSLMGASWKVRNLCPYYSHVGGVRYLKNWGIIIEMLALLGLFRWMWAFDIKPEDEDFMVINTFFKWIESFLYVSVETFCQSQPLNTDTAKMKEEERGLIYTTKQICQYMLRTSVGYGVQCRVRAYVLGDTYGSDRHDPAMSYITGIMGISPMDPFALNPDDPYYLPQPDYIDIPRFAPSYSFTPYPTVTTDLGADEKQKALPKELDTKKGRAMFERAVEEGFFDAQYNWLPDRWERGRVKIALACFVVKASDQLELDKRQTREGYYIRWSLFDFIGYKGKSGDRDQLKRVRLDWMKDKAEFNPPEMDIIEEFFQSLSQP